MFRHLMMLLNLSFCSHYQKIQKINVNMFLLSILKVLSIVQMKLACFELEDINL